MRRSKVSRSNKGDHNRDGIPDELAPPPVDIGAGSEQLKERLEDNYPITPALSGGDIDAAWQDAEGSGEETVGGSVATPDQDVVEEIGAALGITYRDDEELAPGAKERERDRHRWELNPDSAEKLE